MVRRRAGWLDDENVRTTGVFLDLAVELAVGEVAQAHSPHLDLQVAADRLGQRRVRATGKHEQR